LRLASELVDVWEAKTDAGGRYRIANVHGVEGREYQHFAIDVNAAGFVEFIEFYFASFGQVARSGGVVSEVRLERGNAVSGRCVGPDGTIEAGAKIHAAFAGRSMSSLGRARPTDADGRFRLTMPHGLAAELIIYPERRTPPPHDAHFEQLIPRRVSVAAGGGDLGDVRLEAGVESIGTFPPARMPSNQDPSLYTRVPGGTVPIGQVIALESTDRGEFGWFPISVACKTDSSGSFRTPALKGSYKIWAAQSHDSGPDDRGPIVSDVPSLAFMPQVVDFRPRSGVSLSLSVYPPVAIRGKITSPDGTPAQGVSLMLLAAIGGAFENRLTTLQWTTTDAEGHYAFTGIPQGLTGAYLNVYAEPPDNRSHFEAIASGNFQGRAAVSSVSFDPLKRDQDPLEFHLELVKPEPSAPPKVETAEDMELTKLGEEANELEQQFSDALAKCKTDSEREALIKRKLPSNLLAGRFLNLAQAHPGHPVAISALAYIFQRAAGVGDPDWLISQAREQAIDQVIDAQLQNPDTVMFFSALQFGAPSPKGEALLRAALARSPHREVRAGACYELARFLRFMAGTPEVLRTLKEKPVAEEPQPILPRETRLRIMQRFAGVDSAKAHAEAEQLLERVKHEFADVPQPQFMADGPGNLRISRNSTPQAKFKTYGTLADQALFEMRALAVGKVAPDIEGEDADGRRFKLSDYRGKVVVVTFSGNWCGPCREMYPQERELVSRLKDRPFALLSVNTDPERETLLKSIRDGEITWRCWWDGGQDGPITSRWNVLSFPTIFVIDAVGVIRELGTRGRALDQIVERLVEVALSNNDKR
jgi:thiol-disulfide isomerase/thioredoxin